MVQKSVKNEIRKAIIKLKTEMQLDFLSLKPYRFFCKIQIRKQKRIQALKTTLPESKKLIFLPKNQPSFCIYSLEIITGIHLFTLTKIPIWLCTSR